MSGGQDRSTRADSSLITPGLVVFLLCGGLGTRLRSLTERPKAVLEVAGWPFLRYQLESLRTAGADRIVFLTGHGGDLVEQTFAPGTPEADVEPATGGGPDSAPGQGAAAVAPRAIGHGRPERIFVREREPLGTGGALAHGRSYAGRANWVSNADSFADLDAVEMLAAFDGATALVLAVHVDDRYDYGGLSIDEGERIVGFEEKGRQGPGWINGGVYLLPRTFLGELPDGPSSLERDHLPRWAGEGRLRAFRTRGFFRDIGTPERLEIAQREFIAVRRRLEASRRSR